MVLGNEFLLYFGPCYALILSLLFRISLVSLLQEIPCFPLLSREFEGFGGEKRFLPCHFQKNGKEHQGREQKLNTNIFSSNFSGAPGISWQKSRNIPPKVWFRWVSRDIPNFLAPTPSRGRPPPRGRCLDPKFGFVLFFLFLA